MKVDTEGQRNRCRRNMDIWHAVRSGESIGRVAERYELTRQRIVQIWAEVSREVGETRSVRELRAEMRIPISVAERMRAYRERKRGGPPRPGNYRRLSSGINGP